jgi:hypothetical protein
MLVAGFWMLVNGDWSLVPGCWLLVAGYWSSDTVSGVRLHFGILYPDTRHLTPVIGSIQRPVTRDKKPATRDQQPASFRHFFKQQMITKYGNAHCYGAVSYIKGRPVKIADVNVKKIDDNTQTNSVDQIADGSAEYQGKTNPKKRIRRRCFHIKIKNQADSQRRGQKKNNRPHGFTHIGHEAKSPARIVDMGDIKKAGNNSNALVVGQILEDEGLGNLVRQDYQPGYDSQL